MGTSFADLTKIDASRGRSTAIDSRTEKDIKDMKAVNENARRAEQVKRREREINAAYNRKLAAREQQKGTADATVAEAVEGKGPFNPGFAKLAKIDPVAAKAELDEVERTMGRNKEAEPPQKFMRGIQQGKTGDVPYFTNFPGLPEQNVATQVPPNVRDLENYPIEGKTKGLGGNKGTENPLLDAEFKLARARVEAPEKHAKAVTALSMQAEDRSRGFGAENTLKWLDTMMLTGKHQEMGVGEEDMVRIGSDILRRARTRAQLSDTPGTSYFLPLTETDARPGVAADKNSPATVLNPGGGRPAEFTEKDRQQGTISSLIGAVSESVPGVAKRTQDYTGRRVKSGDQIAPRQFGDAQPMNFRMPQLPQARIDKKGKRQRTWVGAGDLGYDFSGMDDDADSYINQLFGLGDR